MFKATDKLGGHAMPSPGLLLNALNMATFQLGPSGLEEIRSERMEYVRIYRATPSLSVSSQSLPPMVACEDEPCGVARINLDKQYWLKLDGRWHDSATNHTVREGFVYDIISQAEFETDLHFDLWKELPVSYRPVRQWFKRKRNLLRRWNMVAACGGVAAMFELLERSSGTDSWHFAVAMGFGIHVCATVVELILSMERGRK